MTHIIYAHDLIAKASHLATSNLNGMGAVQPPWCPEREKQVNIHPLWSAPCQNDQPWLYISPTETHLHPAIHGNVPFSNYSLLFNAPANLSPLDVSRCLDQVWNLNCSRFLGSPVQLSQWLELPTPHTAGSLEEWRNTPIFSVVGDKMYNTPIILSKIISPDFPIYPGRRWWAKTLKTGHTIHSVLSTVFSLWGSVSSWMPRQ